MGPLLGIILVFVFGVAAVVYFTRIGTSILYPTLVNCWYCNNNVFLPANGLDNVERWKCPICESLNVRNKVHEWHIGKFVFAHAYVSNQSYRLERSLIPYQRCMILHSIRKVWFARLPFNALYVY